VTLGDIAQRMLGPRRHGPVVIAVERAVVEPLRLQENDRVVVLNGADEHALRIVRTRGNDGLEAANMRKDRLGALAVRLSAEYAAPGRHADCDRRGELSAGAIAQPRGLRDKLIGCWINVVGELNFRDRAQSVRGHADRRRDDAPLGNRRVEDAAATVLMLKPFGHAKDATEEAHVLPEHEHIRVTRQHHVESGVERLNHVHGRHLTPPSLAAAGADAGASP
jgi:hypothetical protein